LQRYNRRILIITGAVILFLLLFFRERAPEQSRDVVASIGDENITWADFITYTADINQPVSDDERKGLLDEMVMQRLVQRWAEHHPEVQAVIEEGLQKERDYRFRALQQEELNRYMVEEAVQVTEDDVLQYYLAQQPISLYHITFSRMAPDARNKVELARTRLLHGEPWKNVIDSMNNEDGPLAGFYGFYLPGVFHLGDEQYIAAAETLRAPGACTQPLPVPFGWMVLVRGDNPFLDDVKPLLQGLLESADRLRNQEAFTARLRRSYTINDNLLALREDSLSAPDPKSPVVSFAHCAITWEQYIAALHDLYFIDDPFSLSFDRAHELAVELADEEACVQMAEGMKLAGTLRFRLRWEEEKVNLEAGRRAKTFQYVQSRQAPVSDEEILAWYTAHREEYRRPDFYRLQRIELNDEKQARQVWRLATKGSDFNLLVRQYSQQPGYSDSLGNLGLTRVMDKSTLGTLYDTLAACKPGDVLEPRQQEGRWMVYRLFTRIPGAVRGLAEVQSLVRSEVQMDKWRAWVSAIDGTGDLQVQTHYDVLLSKQFPPSRQRK